MYGKNIDNNIVHGDDFVGEDGDDSVLEVLVCCCHCCF